MSTPMENGGKFKKPLVVDEATETPKYQGCDWIFNLCFNLHQTRFILWVLSQFMSKPGTDHWVALKRMLRYIKGSLNLGLVFHSCDNFKLYGLSDADWAGDEL